MVSIYHTTTRNVPTSTRCKPDRTFVAGIKSASCKTEYSVNTAS